MPRFLFSITGAILVATLLFWLMQWLVTPPEAGLPDKADRPAIEIAKPPEEEPETSASASLADPPPPPPIVPAVRLSLNPPITVPAASSSPQVAVPEVSIGGSGLKGSFAGFAGSGGGGAGAGQGFKGERLVPLSTARPQIPGYAFERKIEGWVEVLFVVTEKGKVTNIRIIDAEPKGVFESAMVESIQNWIYPQSKYAREVKQRFEFKLGDFQYNW